MADLVPDPPVGTWLREAFEETVLRLAAARAYWEDLRVDRAPLPERSHAHHQLERLRAEVAPLRDALVAQLGLPQVGKPGTPSSRCTPVLLRNPDTSR